MPIPDWEALGRALRRARGRTTQQAIADHLGVTQPLVSEWESGKGRPTFDQLLRLEDLLRLPRGYFLRAAGLVDTSSERTTREAVMADPALDPLHKEALLAAYDSFVRGRG